jgi:hypothetical protein
MCLGDVAGPEDHAAAAQCLESPRIRSVSDAMAAIRIRGTNHGGQEGVVFGSSTGWRVVEDREGAATRSWHVGDAESTLGNGPLEAWNEVSRLAAAEQPDPDIDRAELGHDVDGVATIDSDHVQYGIRDIGKQCAFLVDFIAKFDPEPFKTFQKRLCGDYGVDTFIGKTGVAGTSADNDPDGEVSLVTSNRFQGCGLADDDLAGHGSTDRPLLDELTCADGSDFLAVREQEAEWSCRGRINGFPHEVDGDRIETLHVTCTTGMESPVMFNKFAWIGIPVRFLSRDRVDVTTQRDSFAVDTLRTSFEPDILVAVATIKSLTTNTGVNQVFTDPVKQFSGGKAGGGVEFHQLRKHVLVGEGSLHGERGYDFERVSAAMPWTRNIASFLVKGVSASHMSTYVDVEASSSWLKTHLREWGRIQRCGLEGRFWNPEISNLRHQEHLTILAGIHTNGFQTALSQ